MSGHEKGEKGPFEGPTLHIKASGHEREKKSPFKGPALHSVPSDHLPHPRAASLARRRQFVLSLPHAPLAATSSSSSLAATSACRCRLFLSLSRTRPLPPAPSVRRRPTARGCSSLTSDLRPPRGPPTPIGEAGPLRPVRKRDWAPSRRRLAEHGF